MNHFGPVLPPGLLLIATRHDIIRILHAEIGYEPLRKMTVLFMSLYILRPG